jgi:hypothetical protein
MTFVIYLPTSSRPLDIEMDVGICWKHLWTKVKVTTYFLETFKVKTDPGGTLDERVDEFTCGAKFTPDGRFSAAIIAALWPHLSANMGTPLFTNTDRPCAFHKRSAGLATMITAAVRKMPTITFSSVKPLVGQVELVGLRGNNLDPDDAEEIARRRERTMRHVH